MKRSILPGLILTIVGIILFAHQGIAQTMQRRTAVEAAAIHSARTVKASERLPVQAFPVGSLLAGFLFMSGIGLIAISAHPGPPRPTTNPDAQS